MTQFPSRSILLQDFSRGMSRSTTERISTPKDKKLGVIFLLCILWSGVVVARLFSLQISNFEKWQEWAIRQHFAEVKLASERGPILDRNDKLFAVSVPAGSVYARPKQIRNKEEAAQKLATALGLPKNIILRKLAEPSPFVWIARQIPRNVAERVQALKDPAIGFAMESRRYYPYNQAGSTLIGKVGIDGQGLSGLEMLHERYLHRAGITTKANKDAYGNIIQSSRSGDYELELPKGDSLKLTIDADLQVIMEEEIERGRADSGAKSIMAVMVDSESGEIITMGQSPGVNFNTDSVDKRALHNLLAETVYEPGSTMKPLVAAAAIDAGVIKPSDMINCEHGRYQFSNKVIKDVHPVDTVSFHDVVVRSSNIGMTKVGARMGRERLYQGLRGYGFGEVSKLGLPGESSGIFRNVSTWAMVDIATHSFGQGIAVTPLQMIRAFSSLANGGNLTTLRLVRDDRSSQSKRIISEKTATQVQEMLYGVVEDEHGTGKLSKIPGIRVGGKTGTAQKARPGGRGYMSGKYIASYIGFADATPIGVKERYSLIVIADEPSKGQIYGGAVAAPIWQRIMQRSLQYLTTRREIGGGSPRPLDGEVSPISSHARS